LILPSKTSIYKRNQKHLRQTSEAPPGTSYMEQGAGDEFTSIEQTNENDKLADSNECRTNGYWSQMNF